jgi:hypothetical protein
MIARDRTSEKGSLSMEPTRMHGSPITRRLVPFICVLLGLLLAASAAPAQDLFVGGSYSISLPTGDTEDFAGNTSWRGLTFEWRKFFRPDVSAGFHLGWNVFDERTERTAEILDGIGAVSGVQFRYVNAFPLLANMHYYLGRPGATVRPFVGGNIGAYVIEQRLELGIVGLEETKWHFGLAPETGLGARLSNTTWFFTSVRYNHAFESGDVPSQTYWSINIGFVNQSYSW